MYNNMEYGKEILNGLKRLLSEKENEKTRLESEENVLRKEIGYQMACHNLYEKIYGALRSPEEQEALNNAVKALRDFESDEKNIRAKMHLSEEIETLKKMIKEMEQ